jgi:hypothetical protein
MKYVLATFTEVVIDHNDSIVGYKLWDNRYGLGVFDSREQLKIEEFDLPKGAVYTVLEVNEAE